MLQEIYIIDDDLELINILENLFKEEKEYVFKSVKTEDINIALKNIPSLIIINEDRIDRDIVDLCKQIREDEDNSITPIVVVTSIHDRTHRIQVLSSSVEYFIKAPIDNEYLYYTVKNIVRLMYTNRRVSPLTGLPGNVQIQAELKKRLLRKEDFAVLYFDLDNFKAYNDIYGFLQGDEVIKFTAKMILNGIHNCGSDSSFVGHIGGDDFVAIISEADYEEICNNIIKEFDTGILTYFNSEDAKRGYLEVANRRGITEQFPLTSLSIGVVSAEKGKFHNILEISEIGAQVKHIAKTTVGSAYAINRRK